MRCGAACRRARGDKRAARKAIQLHTPHWCLRTVLVPEPTGCCLPCGTHDGGRARPDHAVLTPCRTRPLAKAASSACLSKHAHVCACVRSPWCSPPAWRPGQQQCGRLLAHASRAHASTLNRRDAQAHNCRVACSAFACACGGPRCPDPSCGWPRAPSPTPAPPRLANSSLVGLLNSTHANQGLHCLGWALRTARPKHRSPGAVPSPAPLPGTTATL